MKSFYPFFLLLATLSLWPPLADRAIAEVAVTPDHLPGLEPDVAALIAEKVKAAREQPGNAAAHGDLGLAYEANLLWREARASYANAVKLDPLDVLWSYHLAIATHQAGEFDASVDLLREITRKYPDFAPAQQRLGHSLLEQGRLDEAAKAFDRLVQLLPNEPHGYVGRGDVQLRQRRYAEAAGTLERAVQMAPGYRSAQYLLGTAYLRLGKKEEARRALQRGVDAAIAYLESPLAPTVNAYAVNVTARLSQAANLLGAGRAEQAVALLEDSRKSHPENVTLLNNLAIAYMRLNRLDEAEKLLFEARKVDPDKFSTYLNLVSWAMRQRDLDRAHEFATMAIQKAPQMAQPYYSRAQVLAYKSRFEEALDDLAQSALRDHRNPGAHAFSGDLCMRLERFADAREHYRRTLEIDAEFLPAHVGLGDASLALGELEEAQRALDNARKIAPGHPLVQRLEKRIAAASKP